MVLQAQHFTVEDFDTFVFRPENEDRLFEFIGGEVYEVRSNPYSSQIAALFLIALGVFLKGKDLGHVTGEAGGYMVSGERYAPDVAFISKERQPRLARAGYNPNAPDLAVEVVSPTDSERKLSIKVSNYLAAGTVVVVIYPDETEIVVHQPGEPVTVLGAEDTFDGGTMLPGFKLPVRELFPPQESDEIST